MSRWYASPGNKTTTDGPVAGTIPGMDGWFEEGASIAGRALGGALAVILAVGAEVATAAPAPLGPEGERPTAGSVTALYQDRTGFLWIGSREGLGMWDGQRLESFEHDISDPASIADNSVRTIYEDGRGRLWVGTNSGGLDLLDRARGTFRHYRFDSTNPRSLSHDSVNAVLEDRRGRLWVGTQSGLNLLDESGEGFVRYRASPDDPAALADDYVYALYEDRRGSLWIGTVRGGLHRMDPGTGAIERFRRDAEDGSSLCGSSVFTLTEDEDGILWAGTDDGIGRIDPSTGSIRCLRHDPADPTTPGPFVVTTLVRSRDGSIWVGTWGGGLDLLDPRTGAVRRDPNPVDRAADRVVSLLEDRSGAAWVGTWNAGVVRIPPARSHVEVIGAAAAGEPGLSFPDATAVFEDRQGRLWVGTWGEGLNCRQPGESTFRVYEAVPETGRRIGTILSIRQDGGGMVWAGTMSGLASIEPETGRLRFVEHRPGDPSGLGPGYVTALLSDRKGRLWIGTGGSGLHLAQNDEATRFRRFVHDPDDPTSPSDDYVTVLFEDPDGILWVGTRSGGLNLLDPGTGRCRRYLPDPGDPRSFPHHYVTGIARDAAGRAWIGTGGGGIARAETIDDGTVVFHHVTEREGLIDDNVVSLAADDDGTLWIGTRRGLVRHDPRTGAFFNLHASDGLPSEQFNPGSAAAGRDRIYFGSPAGLVVLDRGTPFPAATPSPVVLRAVRTLGGRPAMDRPPWELERIDVPWGEVLILEFVVLDYGQSTSHRYEYRLGGMRDEWIDLGQSREITFTDLDPGRYDLQIRGRNDQGIWAQGNHPVDLRIVPPFWMTGWFRGVVVAGLVFAVLGAHRLRTSALQRRNRELEHLQRERERALADARASEEELQRAYGRLRRLTGRLEAAKEEERRRISRELHDEMGQALTAAKINLQILDTVNEPEARRRRVEDTVGLVDRMIQHVRALSLDLRPPLLDELGLVPALRGFLEAQSQRSALHMEVLIDDALGSLSPETEILVFRAVQEAVTNVIRHAAATRVEVEVRRRDGGLRVRVRDDGRGFDVQRAMEKALSGRHLGILGIRERVESAGGSLWIESAPGHGTEVELSVPFREEVGS